MSATAASGAAAQSRPVVVIMYGPPGSGKSSTLKYYVERFLPWLGTDVKHLDLDSFVLSHPGYKRSTSGIDFASKDAAPRASLAFKKHVDVAREEFELAVEREFVGRRNFAFDVVGRVSVDWVRQYMTHIKKHDYAVHVVYPFVYGHAELCKRVSMRFTATRQPPAPEFIIDGAMDDAPKNLKALARMLGRHLRRLAIFDNSSYSKYAKRFVFIYDSKSKECSFMEAVRFQPCVPAAASSLLA